MCGTVLNNKMKIGIKWKYWYFKSLEKFFQLAFESWGNK